MNWIKENKTLAGILGFTLLGVIGLGVLLFMTMGAYSTAKEEWTQSGNTIKQLKSQKLYPSEANVAQKRASVTEYGKQVEILRNALLSPTVQMEIKDTSETEFQARLKDRVNAVKRAADAAGILLPTDFALGFEDYTGSLPRSPQVAAELNVQLDVIEKLFNALLESGVVSVDSFVRNKLPNERGDAPAPGAPAPAVTGGPQEEPVLDRFTYKVLFTADQAPFQSVLNILSDPRRMPHFLVVRLARVENTNSEGPRKEDIRKPGQDQPPGDVAPAPEVGADAAAAVAGAPQAIPVITPAPEDAVTIMGDEKLKVTLELDYIRFRPEPAVAGADKKSVTGQP